MGRLPFDPDKMVGPARPDAGAERDRAVSVSDLARLISGALAESMPRRVRVRGEISGFNDRTHWYFSLKDESAVVSCVMFASAAAKAGFRPEHGAAVLAEGRVEFYAKQGRTQLYVDRLEPVGEGALEARFRALCDELRAAGWFDAERKRPVPAFPRRVAVLTSRTSAAWQDVLDTARRRCPAVELALVDVLVQGEGAAPGIASALGWVGREAERLGIDALLLTRGGGSLEDLWAFNDRGLAEAIVRSPVPVVAAVGHESDTTIAELVADLRCATPTQAAMALTPDAGALAEQTEQSGRRLELLLARALERASQRLDAAARRPAFADPTRLVSVPRERLAGSARAGRAGLRHRLDRARLRLERAGAGLARARPEAVFAARAAALGTLEHALARSMRARLRAFDADHAKRRLARAARSSVEARAERLDALQRELIVIGPAHVLSRGYSVTTDADGRVVRSTGDAAPGQRVRTLVADGTFESVVEGDAPGAPVTGTPAPAPPRTRRRRKPRPGDDPGQMGLF